MRPSWFRFAELSYSLLWLVPVGHLKRAARPLPFGCAHVLTQIVSIGNIERFGHLIENLALEKRQLDPSTLRLFLIRKRALCQLTVARRRGWRRFQVYLSTSLEHHTTSKNARKYA